MIVWSRSGLVDTMSRALLFVRDTKQLEMQKADLDEVDEEKDYYRPTGALFRENPYAA